MKRLLLLGGGHSHLLVLEHLRRRPAPGVEAVVVSPNHLTAYAGMIPGLIAGDYDYRACHIDLARPAASAGARFVQDRARTIDPSNRTVVLEGGPPVSYDVLSVNVGSTSASAARHADDGTFIVPIRPIEQFLQSMQHLWLRARQGELSRLAVVGGGAAGAELGLALHYRMNRAGGQPVSVVIVSEARRLLAGRSAAASDAIERLCRARGVALALGASVEVSSRGVTLAGGHLDAQAVVWATSADAYPWIAGTGLATDARGFIAVDACLQSISHKEVFAAGDCATSSGAPLPGSGMPAVRQGPALASNLRRALSGAPLKPHRVSPHALAVLNCGGRYALASWRGVALHGRWIWRWKNRLDRRFMARFV